MWEGCEGEGECGGVDRAGKVEVEVVRAAGRTPATKGGEPSADEGQTGQASAA